MTLAEWAATKSGFSIGNADSAATIAHSMVRDKFVCNAFVQESALAESKNLSDLNCCRMGASKNLFPDCESLLKVTLGQSKLLQLEVDHTNIAKRRCIFRMLFPMEGQRKP